VTIISVHSTNLLWNVELTDKGGYGDADGKGYLTKADLKAVIEPMKGINAERAEILMQELDIGQADQIQRWDWYL
jgi:hypothetical protein